MVFQDMRFKKLPISGIPAPFTETGTHSTDLRSAAKSPALPFSRTQDDRYDR